jgi:AGCS family alanine or glycine:cation symporter
VLGADGYQFYTKEQKMFLLVPDLQSAMDSVFPGFGSYFVAIALFFFAFTTMLAYYYIAETNISYLTRNLKSPIYNHLLKVLMMVVIMYGINQAKLAWNIGDLGVGLMAWFNIIAILLLQNRHCWH